MLIVLNEEDLKKLKSFKHLKYSEFEKKYPINEYTFSEFLKEKIISDISHLNTLLELSFPKKEKKSN